MILLILLKSNRNDIKGTTEQKNQKTKFKFKFLNIIN